MRSIIIAEAGVNHNGSLSLAKRLIDVASEARADYVKFQTFKAGSVVTETADKAEYQKDSTGEKESQYDMLKKLELSFEDHKKLISYCNKKNIRFLSTAFDLDGLSLLEKINIPLIKIPSGEITSFPYLQKIGEMGKPIIMSTGMSSLNEISNSIDVLINSGAKKENITILHCNTEYPTPMEDVNLSAMITIRDELGVSVGYSDHSLGIEVPIAAAALGAKVIEKHITIDKNLPGPDHGASIEPIELKNMVKSIRNIEKALGSGIKEPSPSEIKNIVIARRSIVASKFIKKDEKFSVNNLTLKRPGSGISPMNWEKIIGKKAKKNFNKDDLIET